MTLLAKLKSHITEWHAGCDALDELWKIISHSPHSRGYRDFRPHCRGYTAVFPLSPLSSTLQARVKRGDWKCYTAKTVGDQVAMARQRLTSLKRGCPSSVVGVGSGDAPSTVLEMERVVRKSSRLALKKVIISYRPSTPGLEYWSTEVWHYYYRILADRTNGRACDRLQCCVCLSSSVSNVMYCG